VWLQWKRPSRPCAPTQWYPFRIKPQNTHARVILDAHCCLCAFALPATGDMPAHTTTQDACSSRSHDMRAMPQQQRDCTVSNHQQVGDVVGYHLVCAGDPPKMTGDARFELLLNGSVKGSVHANSSMGGHNVLMDMAYAGERTGSCDYIASRQKR
jgi:hypothetical protein